MSDRTTPIPPTDVEVQADRLRRVLSLLNRDEQILARPQMRSVLLRSTWKVCGLPVSIERAFTVDKLKETDDTAVRLLMRATVDKHDEHLVVRSTAMLAKRSRELRMTLGQWMAEVER